MALWLQAIIALVLVTLCAALVPLFLQLRRTARAVQELAESARTDLHGMAEDVHQVRGRVDQLADLAAAGMSLPATLGDLIASFSRGLPDLLGGRGGGWLPVLIAGFQFIRDLFAHRGAPSGAPEGKGPDTPA